MTHRTVPALAPVQLRSLREILASTRLLSMATVSSEGHAHINTAFFSFADDCTIYILTPPATEHARHLRSDPSAALAIYDSHQTRRLRRGAQLFGTMAEVSADAAPSGFRCFCARFPDVATAGEEYRDFIRHHDVRLFEFHAARVKLFDEELLERGDYVEARFD